MKTVRWTTPIIAATALLVLAAGDALAHGEATLASPSSSVTVGSTLTVTGSGFVPGEAHRLLLRGTLEEREIRTVTAGADSTFTADVELPADARPGQYRIVAVAPDGAEVATLDLPLLAAEGGEEGEEHTASEAGSSAAAAGNASGARADEIRIERSRAGLEWGVIGLVVGLAGGLGLGLLRRT